jgi:hypothetical protein
LKKLYMDLEPEESEYVAERSRLELVLAPTAVPEEEVTTQAGHYQRKGVPKQNVLVYDSPKKKRIPSGEGG